MRITATIRYARGALVLLAGLALLVLTPLQAPASTGEAHVLPEFGNRSAEAWLNSAPLQRADLAGKVVLIEAWSTS